MLRTNVKYLIVCVAVAAMVALGAVDSQACGRRGGCGGCCNTCGCNTCGCGGVVSDCGCGGVIQGTIVPGLKPTPVAPIPPYAPMPAPRTTGLGGTGSGLITIWVPEEAKVYINGLETKSTGNMRQYVSSGLIAGYVHTYEIRAVAMRNGQPVEELRHVELTVGQRSAVAFSFAPDSNTRLAALR
jgi:uncharacterized protein (TIGR03000 family)